MAAFIRCTTHAEDMDSVELATCAVCDDQRIDTPREIRLHLGTKCVVLADKRSLIVAGMASSPIGWLRTPRSSPRATTPSS